MPNIPTPFDAEKDRAKARLATKQAEAEALAKRARDALRDARKAEQVLKGIDRKRRDRARYIIGGIMEARLRRQEPDRVRQWLDTANMSEADKAIVEHEFADVLGQERTLSDGDSQQPVPRLS